METSSTDDLFVPVVVRSAAAQVADQIVAAIQTDRIEASSRLPSERDLARSLGVSRPTLREALAGLELAGIIETKRGRGTIVVASPEQVANWGVEVNPTQVFEARLVIEPQLARLAAEKRYPEDVEHLQSVCSEHESEFARTGQYESDLQVHRAIARAAHNPVLVSALEECLRHTLSGRWVELRSQALRSGRSREGHVEEVRRVIDHIAAGEADHAERVWREHLEYFQDEMIAGLHGQNGAPTAS